jgi:hypothetical protein
MLLSSRSEREVKGEAMRNPMCAVGMAGAALAFVFLQGCGGSSPGLEGQSIVPCDQGDPSFDVWRANFDPTGRHEVLVSVDTKNDATAAEFRLVVACNEKVVVNTTRGAPCSNTPPHTGVSLPECPIATFDLAPLGTGRIECLAEITSTESLHIGVGDCADKAKADYEIIMRIDGVDLALDVVADDCRDEFSCLERQFGIDVPNS